MFNVSKHERKEKKRKKEPSITLFDFLSERKKSVNLIYKYCKFKKKTIVTLCPILLLSDLV